MNNRPSVARAVVRVKAGQAPRKRRNSPTNPFSPGSPIEDLTFQNVRITVKGGHPAAEADLQPKENDGRFPRDIGAVPAYGFFLRHVKGISFTDCAFGFERDDGRPAFVVESAEGVVLLGCELQIGAGRESAVDARGGAGVRILPRSR